MDKSHLPGKFCRLSPGLNKLKYFLMIDWDTIWGHQTLMFP